jgi:hypothetical protein
MTRALCCAALCCAALLHLGCSSDPASRPAKSAAPVPVLINGERAATLEIKKEVDLSAHPGLPDVKSWRELRVQGPGKDDILALRQPARLLRDHQLLISPEGEHLTFRITRRSVREPEGMRGLSQQPVHEMKRVTSIAIVTQQHAPDPGAALEIELDGEARTVNLEEELGQVSRDEAGKRRGWPLQAVIATVRRSPGSVEIVSTAGTTPLSAEQIAGCTLKRNRKGIVKVRCEGPAGGPEELREVTRIVLRSAP